MCQIYVPHAPCRAGQLRSLYRHEHLENCCEKNDTRHKSSDMPIIITLSPSLTFARVSTVIHAHNHGSVILPALEWSRVVGFRLRAEIETTTYLSCDLSGKITDNIHVKHSLRECSIRRETSVTSRAPYLFPDPMLTRHSRLIQCFNNFAREISSRNAWSGHKWKHTQNAGGIGLMMKVKQYGMGLVRNLLH